jgi:hypothetical protein
MVTKYYTEIDNDAIQGNLSRILSQVFKLLPMREEEKE